MFTFSIVKKIGKGKYLKEDPFIIERIRRERALNTHYLKFTSDKQKTRYGKRRFS